MNADHTWQQWQRDWQAEQPAVDAVALTRRVNRKRIRMIIFQALDILIAIWATVNTLIAWLDRAMFGWHVAAALILIVWVFVALDIWLRRGTWRPQTGNVRALLELTRRRAHAGIGFIWASFAGMALVYAVLAPWFIEHWRTAPPNAHAPLIGILVAQAILLVAMLAWAIWYGRRQRRTLRHTRELLRQFDGQDAST
ncbi:MAG TPA: hypothetical protein VF271_09330 [Rhodanobacteraceae bacterium]